MLSICNQYNYTLTQPYTALVDRPTLLMQSSMAIFGAIAHPAPSLIGIEVIRRDGLTMAREAVSSWLT